MINLYDAIAIAKTKSDKFNAYQEYEDAYVFFVDDGEITDGGAERNCIIAKESGDIIPWAMYFLTGEYGCKEIGEIKRL